MTLRSAPRIILVPLIVLLLLAAGVAAIFLVGTGIGIAAIAGVLIIGWSSLKYARRQLAGRIETLPAGVRFTLHGNDADYFPWEEIRFAGIAAGARRGERRQLFVYRETDDRLFTVTDEFENLDSLIEELRRRTRFNEISLAEGEELAARLRALLAEA